MLKSLWIILITCSLTLLSSGVVGARLPAPDAIPVINPRVLQMSVVITTSDNMRLNGTFYTPWYGSDTAVIFSTTGEGKEEDWAALARETAEHGYDALTYNFRVWTSPTQRDASLSDKAYDDLLAVIAFGRSRGAKHLILIGASLGGMATAKAGKQEGVAGIVVISSPMEANGLKMQVTPKELDVPSLPKLFIASETDQTVAAAATQKMYDQASDPKQIVYYPGSAHGTNLFKTRDAADFTAKLLTFIAANAPRVIQQSKEAQTAWREDLRALDVAIRKEHPNQFFQTPEADFQKMVMALDTDIPYLTTSQIKAGLVRIAAVVDGHTMIPTYQPAIGFHRYPLRFYLFSDGLYVIAAQQPYQTAIGKRLIQVGHTSVERAWQTLQGFASRDNEMTIKLNTPLFFIMPETLHASGLIDDPAQPNFLLEDMSGKTMTLNPSQMTSTEYQEWLVYPSGVGLFQRPGPLYLQRRNEAFWYTYLEDSQTLYIQYNMVQARTSNGLSLLEFSKELDQFANSHEIERTVIDLRHNLGGDNTTYGPLLKVIRDNRIINRGRKLFTIIGRATFSAGTNFAAELEKETKTLFVGEPTANQPNLYGDVRPIVLPNSKIIVNVSSRYWLKSTPDDHRLSITPQLPVTFSSQDYFADQDPMLEAILHYQR
jgi:esterase/lipase